MATLIELDLAKPKTQGRLDTAFVQSIVLAQKCGYDWVMSHYIQLYADKAVNVSHTINVQFYTGDVYDGWMINPFFMTYRMPLKYSAKSIVDLIESMLNDKCYLLLQDKAFLSMPINEYLYVPYYYIVGYDADNKKFKMMKFDYGQFCIGWYDAKDVIMNIDNWFAGEAILFKYTGSLEYMLDMEYVLTVFKEYRDSINPSTYLRIYHDVDNDHTFGLGIYQSLFYYLGLLENNNAAEDIRPFYTLTEHKSLMVERLGFLKEKHKNIDMGSIEKYKNVHAKCHTLTNRVLKHHVKQEKWNCSNIRAILHEIMEEETDALSLIIQ